MAQDQAGVVAALLASSDDEAARRFEKTYREDPLPDVPAALLNSADLIDYVVKTGMIHPFDLTAGKLKPASYALSLLGKAVWWDPKTHRRHVAEVKRGDEFVLPPNAIAYVTLEPKLRIPDYIALRFNLKIRNVYRGLLLGTGPLIDPGFVGHLSFPLHNLTTNEYVFRGGDDVIWIEFTKLSPNERWTSIPSAANERVGYYVPFSKATNDHDVETYIQEAVGRRKVISSISAALQDATRAAQRAKKWTAAGVMIGLFTAGALIVGIAALIVSIFTLGNDMPSRNDLDQQHAQIQRLETQVANLRKQIPSTVPKPGKNP